MSKKVVPKVPSQDDSEICYTVSIPKPDDVVIDNLQKFIAAKETIIKQAFNVDALPIEINDDTLTFNWLPENATQEEIHALMVFITKLCDTCSKLKRVTVKDKGHPNPKYAFRCLLLRIGMIGDEYKRDRCLLLSRLTGNSSYLSKRAEKE